MADIIHIRARESWALALVGGLPLFLRLCRQASRAGFERAIVDAGENASVVRRLLLKRPPGLPVDVRDGVAGTASQALDGGALYDDLAAPPVIVVRDRASLLAAEAHLWGKIRKSVEADGVVTYFLAKPLTVPITTWLATTAVRPNHITSAALTIGLVSASFAACGHFALAYMLYLFAWLIDCIDGDLARLRLEGSRFGEWFDTISDDTTTLAMTAATGFGLAMQGTGHCGVSSTFVIGVGIAGALGYAISSAVLYRYLASTTGPVDTARFPWWFMKAPAVQGGGGGAIGKLQYLNRRDFQALAMGVLGLVGLAWLNFIWLVTMGLVYPLLLGVHYGRGRHESC